MHQMGHCDTGRCEKAYDTKANPTNKYKPHV
jgi:hypothetical protein